MNRRTVRLGAAGVAAAMAAIYVLIGLGVVTVVAPAASDGSMLAFGLSAGSIYFLGAILLATVDRRPLWLIGIALQLFVLWGYLAVAPDRTPAFEIWGVTLRVLQVPLLVGLIYLAVRPPAATSAIDQQLDPIGR